MQYILIIIALSLPPISPRLPTSPSQICILYIFFFLCNPLIPVQAAQMSLNVWLYTGAGAPTRGPHTSKENRFFLSRSHQLPIAPQLGWDLMNSGISTVFILLQSCAGKLSCSKFLSTAVLCRKHYLISILSTSGPHTLCTPSSEINPESWGVCVKHICPIYDCIPLTPILCASTSYECLHLLPSTPPIPISNYVPVG